MLGNVYLGSASEISGGHRRTFIKPVNLYKIPRKRILAVTLNGVPRTPTHVAGYGQVKTK
jgi:hypothetical protein